MARRKSKKRGRTKSQGAERKGTIASGNLGWPTENARGTPRTGAAPPWNVIPSFVPANIATRNIFAALSLCVMVAVFYFPAVFGGFVWDDAVIQGAHPLREGWSGLWKIWFAPRTLIDYEGHYWPTLYTTIWLEHKLWGFAPAGYHIVNIILHAAASVLLWRLLLRLEFSAGLAWLIAAVFAVHPLHVESVAWIIGRKDILATLFYVGCCIAYIRFLDERRHTQYALALALFVLALISKSVALTLPFALLIWHWWKQGRITGDDFARIAPFFLIGLLIAIFDIQYYKDRDPTSFDYSFVQRALIAARALWFYAGQLAWPSNLSIIYPRWEMASDDLFGWACLIGAAAIPILLWRYRRRIGRGALAGALFFTITLAPVIGFVDYGYMLYSFVADRYQYLGGIGVIAVLTCAAVWAAERFIFRPLASAAPPNTGAPPSAAAQTTIRRQSAQALTLLLPAAVLTTLGVITWHQSGLYRDNFTLYSHIVSLNPQARFAHHSLGQQYHKRGEYEKAIEFFKIDYRLAKNQPSSRIRFSKNHISMGRAYEALGQFDKAEENYLRAYQLTPHFGHALDNLGGFLINKKRYKESLPLFQALVEMTPGNSRFHVGLGISLAGVQRFREAMRAYDRALALDPTNKMAQSSRARLAGSLQK